MTGEPFTIRSAIPADIPALRALIEASVRGLQLHDYTPAQIEGALGHTLGLDTQLIADRTYFAATPAADNHASPQTVVACGGWSFRRTLFGSDAATDRQADRLDPLQDPARIRAIFVHPAWARRGLGTLMLAHCEQAARHAGFTRAAMGSTLTGVPLYTLKGYTPQQTVHVPLPNGESLPVVYMSKLLVP